MIVLAVMWVLAGCQSGGGDADSDASQHVSGSVVGAGGQALANATVYLVPADAIDESTIVHAQLLDGEAEAYDEPLEDLVGSESVRAAVTDGTGAFSFAGVADGDYFLWAAPAAGDSEHLPGGAQCRIATKSSYLAASDNRIVLSSSPSAAATHVGSSACIGCHADLAGHKLTAHANSVRAPGSSTSLQDLSQYPGFDDGLAAFISGADYSVGTELFFEDYDASRGVDRFEIFVGATGGGSVHFRAYLWQDNADDRHKITLVNESAPADTKELTVKLTLGGALYQQKYLVTIAGRRGHYPFLQYQHDGDSGHYDRTRQPWRDYRAADFWDDVTGSLKDPPADATFEGNCAACHVTGFSTEQDGATGEWLADAVVDPGGIDFDGDGQTEEINVGCECCHGPGSEHVAADSARYITDPAKLTPNRADQICGRCHDRVQGKGTVQNDQPLSADDRTMVPGMRRAEFLAAHASRKSAAASDLWAEVDALHSKSDRQQTSDHLKSRHTRNSRRLVVCSDCHDLHDNRIDHQLLYSTAPDSLLCQRCHAIDVTTHMSDEIGTTMSGSVTSCVSCHMPKTARSGAGTSGFLLGSPTGADTDEAMVFWQNDISSHTFAVPSRFTAMGSTPGSAMPTPYTGACGICHVPSQLPLFDPRDAATCGGCHSDTYRQWETSPHAQLVTRVTGSSSGYYASSCFRCHVGQRFIQERLAGAGSYTGALPYADPMPQTCTVCHYPHYASTLAAKQLRAVGRVRVPDGGTYVQANKARLCIMCHNSRQSDPETAATATWAGTVWRLTGAPHSANQSETFLGIGAVTSYSIDGVADDALNDSYHATQDFIAPGQDATQMCLTCHMHTRDYSASHSWDAEIASCALCHAADDDWSSWGGAAVPTFAVPARGDYDGDGARGSVDDEIHGLLNRVLGALTDGTGAGLATGFGFTWLGRYPYWELGADQLSPPDADAAKAAYNVVLFEHDPAAGSHNAAYAVQVLRNTWRMLGRKLAGDPGWQPPGADWQDP